MSEWEIVLCTALVGVTIINWVLMRALREACEAVRSGAIVMRAIAEGKARAVIRNGRLDVERIK
jgi:hypothetical protein